MYFFFWCFNKLNFTGKVGRLYKKKYNHNIKQTNDLKYKSNTNQITGNDYE